MDAMGASIRSGASRSSDVRRTTLRPPPPRGHRSSRGWPLLTRRRSPARRPVTHAVGTFYHNTGQSSSVSGADVFRSVSDLSIRPAVGRETQERRACRPEKERRAGVAPRRWKGSRISSTAEDLQVTRRLDTIRSNAICVMRM